jgi:hypothetical protein
MVLSKTARTPPWHVSPRIGILNFTSEYSRHRRHGRCKFQNFNTTCIMSSSTFLELCISGAMPTLPSYQDSKDINVYYMSARRVARPSFSKSVRRRRTSHLFFFLKRTESAFLDMLASLALRLSNHDRTELCVSLCKFVLRV